MGSPKRMKRPHDAILLLGLIGLLWWLWSMYMGTAALHVGLPDYLGEVLPIYGFRRAIYLTQADTLVRALVAIAAFLIGAGALALASAKRLPAALLLAIGVVSVLGVNVSVACIGRGLGALAMPFTKPALEYIGDVPLVGDDPLGFIQRYPTLGSQLSLHGGTHPPGAALFLWIGESALERFGFAGAAITPERAACIAIGFTALGIVPAYWLAQIVSGTSAARRMLPFYLAAPGLVLFGATSMDGVFLVFVLASLAAAFKAMKSRSLILWPLVAGAALWLATFMTFTSLWTPVLMACCVAIAALRSGKLAGQMLVRCVLTAIAFVFCQAIAQLVLHYDLLATVHAAMDHDRHVVGRSGYESLRIWFDLSLGNAFAFLIGSGLATTALFALALVRAVRSPRRSRSRFVLSLAAALLLLSVSTLFTMETDRVWLAIKPAMLIVTVSAVRDRMTGVLALCALFLQTMLIELNVYTYW